VSRKRLEDYDDGRVIAPMNVDGMPWYKPDRRPRESEVSAGDPVHLTRRENIAFSFGVLKAVLLIAFVYIAVMLGFILFCTNVWFR